MSNEKSEYLDEVTGDKEFRISREEWRTNLAADENLYKSGLALQKELSKHNYVYQWNWMGIPIIKMPDDIMVLQEFYFDFRPTAVIEVGVARGGGIALAVSLQRLCETPVHVLGIDIKFFDHTKTALAGEFFSGVELFEKSSTDPETINKIKSFISGHEKIFVTLDSDHTHQHVLNELNAIAPLLPSGSVILVADTILKDIVLSDTPRSWNSENNPGTAVDEFLSLNNNWKMSEKYSRRAVLTESRDGWLLKT
jgi:cephalosporin hydroxylase